MASGIAVEGIASRPHGISAISPPVHWNDALRFVVDEKLLDLAIGKVRSVVQISS
jgi:hypothetical protein